MRFFAKLIATGFPAQGNRPQQDNGGVETAPRGQAAGDRDAWFRDVDKKGNVTYTNRLYYEDKNGTKHWREPQKIYAASDADCDTSTGGWKQLWLKWRRGCGDYFTAAERGSCGKGRSGRTIGSCLPAGSYDKNGLIYRLSVAFHPLKNGANGGNDS
jgi:hypothetical protein